MDDLERAARRDDPVEGGSLEDEGEGSREEPATGQDQPVESGALEEKEGRSTPAR